METCDLVAPRPDLFPYQRNTDDHSFLKLEYSIFLPKSNLCGFQHLAQ